MPTTLLMRAADNETLHPKTETKSKYPLVVISDVHLGMKFRTKNDLEKFLKELDCDTLVLNGDIIDGLRISARGKPKFTQEDTGIIDALNDIVARGTKVVYVPGNHDEALRAMDLYGKTVMGITFAEAYIHTTPEGKRFHISHGDQFDKPLQRTTHISPQLFKIGDLIYGAAGYADSLLNKVSQTMLKRQFDLYGKVRKQAYNQIIQVFGSFGDETSGKRLPPKEIAKNLVNVRKTLKGASNAAEDFREAALAKARKDGFDGIVCGHTHMPELSKSPDGIIYANSGDWVRHFSALALTRDGEWQIIGGKKAELEIPVLKKVPPKEPSSTTQEMLKAVSKVWNKKAPTIYSGYKGI